MTEATDPKRAAVLASIRQSLGRPGPSRDARRELDDRIRRHKPNLIPKRGRGSHAEQVERFVAMAESVAATVERLETDADVPAALAAYLRQHNLPMAVMLAPTDWLCDLPWDTQPMLTVQSGRARNQDVVSLTPAFAGIAETGTLMMTSGDAHPTTLNFLPDHHVVAIRKSQIVGAYEDAWDRLRKHRKNGRGFDLPRTVNMITGPSRTGDIELTIHLGAHGPRSLHILLIDDDPA